MDNLEVLVEKLWKNLGESVWVNCGKVSTNDCKNSVQYSKLWESGNCTHFLDRICRLISTKFLRILTCYEEDLHIFHITYYYYY